MAPATTTDPETDKNLKELNPSPGLETSLQEMTQNILIEFTSDASGLTPGEDGVRKLLNLDKDIASSFDKTNTSIKARQALIDANTTALTKFAQGIQNVNKAAIGDTYSKVLTGIRQQLQLTDIEAKDFYQNIIQNSNKAIVSNANQQEVANLTQLIKDATAALAEFQTEKQTVNETPVTATATNVNIPETTTPVEVPVKIVFSDAEVEAAINNLKQQLSSPINAGLLSQATVQAEKILPTLAEDSQAFKDLDAQVLRANLALQDLGNAQDSAGQSTLRATTILRNMRQELLVMEEQGISFSTKFGLSFDDLSVRAAKLQHEIDETRNRITQMASGTFAINAVVEALSGVAAGFNLASGAAILFGGEQKDVQQAILKVQGAMQLLAGIQQISALFSEQSIARTGVEVLIKKLFTSTTQAQATALVEQKVAQEGVNVAEGEGVVVTEALNVAMKANPIGIILGLVALAVTAFATYKLTLGSVTDEEERRVKTIEAMNDAEAKAADAFAKEEASLNVLLATAKNKALTDQEQESAIEKINQQFPEYLSNLTTANVSTAESSKLIENEIALLKERAIVQASEDLYVEKLKAVAEAEANLNKIRTQGASYWEKLKGQIENFGSALTGTTAQENAEKNAIDDLNDANKDASIAIDVVNTKIQNVSSSLNKGIVSFQNYTSQFNLFAKTLSQPIAFNPEVFDAEKKKALELAQYELDLTTKGSDAELAAKRKLIQTEFDEDTKRINAQYGNEVNTNQNALDASAAAYKKYTEGIQQLDQQARDKFFKDEIANAEALVLQQEALGKEGSQAFFDARKQVLIETAQAAIAQEGITAGEIKKINAQLNVDLQNLEIERKDKALEIQKTLTQDRLDLAEKGSKDELNAEIAILEIEKQTQINNAKGNAVAIQEINDNFRKQELDKILAFNQKVQQESDNAAISDTQHQISELQLQGAQDTGNAIIELKKKLIEQQAQLEIDSIPVSGITEEKRRELIRSIQDKELLDKKALEDAKNQAEIEAALKAQQDILNIQKEGLNGASSVIGAFGPARIALDNAITQNELANIQLQKNALVDKFSKGLIGFTDFYNQVKALDDQSTEALIANAERAAQAKTAAFNFFADTLDKSLGLVFDNEKRQLEESAQNTQDLYDKKLITQNEFNRQQQKLKRQEAALDKEKAIFDIIIEFAKQLFAIKAQAAALASNPITAPFAAVALAQIPLLIASEAISLGFVAAQKLKKGKVKIDGDGTETSDSIPTMLSKNESVINAAATKGSTSLNGVTIKHEEALRAINEFRFPEYLNNIFTGHDSKEMIREFPFEKYLLNLIPHFDMPVFTTPVFEMNPVMKDLPKWVEKHISREIINTHDITELIDYDQMGEKVGRSLGKVVGKELRKNPAIQIGFDDKEMYAYMKNKTAMEAYANKRRGYIK